uniref:Retrotrans_gag domain-containing protein n=1 Tax=Glossina pallidipes TaxID=7398 RepID=A0A1B0A7A9_GLOPL
MDPNASLSRRVPCMNPSIGPDHTPLAADTTLASRFDQEFRRFQLGRRDNTEEYSRSNSITAHFASFGRKLDKLFEMPGSESGDTIHNATGSVTENGDSTYYQQGSPAQASGCKQQLMEMLKQQNEALLSCMQEIGNLKRESNTGTRQSQAADTEGTRHFGLAASTSTPNQHVPPQTAVLQNVTLQTAQHNKQTEQPRAVDENTQRRKVDLNRWHLKFDGSGKGLTVESFIFRIERLRQQQHISHENLFAEFHCLMVGQANKWYWQLMEDREGDSTFDSLKAELLNQFKIADSDYELIREVTERKQQQPVSFEDYYAEIHDLTFRLRRQIPESELIKIMKSNVKPSLATLIFATKVESVAELKAECKRTEKLLKERSRQVNEVGQEAEASSEAHSQTVEAFAPRYE